MHRRHSKSPSRASSPQLVSTSSTSTNSSNCPHQRSASSSPERVHSSSSSPTGVEVPSTDAFQPHRSSLTAVDMALLCLNPKMNHRRHSSDMKSSLPRISISRAKSDIDLMLTSVHPHVYGASNSLDHCGSVLVNGAAKHANSKTPGGGGFCIAPSYVTLKPMIPLMDHNYQTVTKVLKCNKCRVCSESIYFHGYECTQCKMVVHKKCSSSLFVKCPNKVMPPRLAVFGLSISDDSHVSEVLSVCIREIENRPIHKLKYIYKMEYNQRVVDSLCLSFEFGAHLVDLSTINVYNVAGVVKEYLSRLSTPIFSKSVQEDLISLGRDWPVRKVPYTQSGMAILIFELRQLVSYLSAPCRNNLAYLIYHFRRVADRHNITEMTANSLGVVFANIIFRSYDSDNSTAEEATKWSNSEVPVNGTSSASSSPAEECTSTSVGSLIHLPTTPTRATSPVRQPSMTINVDVTFKIRILELMILYVHEIFS